jgi:hypothetical protein
MMDMRPYPTQMQQYMTDIPTFPTRLQQYMIDNPFSIPSGINATSQDWSGFDPTGQKGSISWPMPMVVSAAYRLVIVYEL